MKRTCYDGRLLPPIPEEMEPERALPSSGALLLRDNRKIIHGSHGADGARLIPETRMKDQRLQWDSRNPRFTNNEKANELLHIR